MHCPKIESSSTTKLATDLPIAWAMALVVRRAKSVVLHSSLKAVGSRLVHGAEELGLEVLQHDHGVKCRGCMAGGGVCTSGESRGHPARLRRVGDFCLPPDGGGWAEKICSEICSFKLAKRQQGKH